MSVETTRQLAVALHYDKTGAPRVIAKGKGNIGARIIEVAAKRRMHICYSVNEASCCARAARSSARAASWPAASASRAGLVADAATAA